MACRDERVRENLEIFSSSSQPHHFILIIIVCSYHHNLRSPYSIRRRSHTFANHCAYPLARSVTTFITRLHTSLSHTMFGGAFRPTLPTLGGLLWKNPWRLSATRRNRVRSRLRAVDDVISTLSKSNIECHALNRALAIPREDQMLAKDKYTTFSKHDRGFRKSVHKVPKWTRLTIRENPVGY